AGAEQIRAFHATGAEVPNSPCLRFVGPSGNGFAGRLPADAPPGQEGRTGGTRILAPHPRAIISPAYVADCWWADPLSTQTETNRGALTLVLFGRCRRQGSSSHHRVAAPRPAVWRRHRRRGSPAAEPLVVRIVAGVVEERHTGVAGKLSRTVRDECSFP